MSSEGEFKKHAITQWDMRNRLREIIKETDYFKDGKFNPTDENIQAQIDYKYKAQFVPIEVLDKAKAELLFTFLLYGPVDLTKMKPLIDWYEKWFGVFK